MKVLRQALLDDCGVLFFKILCSNNEDNKAEAILLLLISSRRGPRGKSMNEPDSQDEQNLQ